LRCGRGGWHNAPIISVIPYFEAPNIGPIQPWGFFVASGALLSIILAGRVCKRWGLDQDVMSELAAWVLVGGFVGARLVHVFLYRWVDYEDNLGDIFKMWEGGLSSYGGFVFAPLVGAWFVWKKKLNVLHFGDVCIFAFMPGWTLGRVGCFAIHDHPGRITDFFLAAEMKLQPIGAAEPFIQARHDLGLYDGILTLVLSALFFWWARRPRPIGFYVAWGSMLYAVPRFFLDYLRATDLSWSDTRYLGLTPAQYGSIILLAFGAWILTRRLQPLPSSS